MRRLLNLWILGLHIGQFCLAQATPQAQLRPLVIWHGLFDSYNSIYMHSLEQRLQKTYPGIFIYFARVSNNSVIDQRATYVSPVLSPLAASLITVVKFGNLDDEIEAAANDLRSVPQLQDGFNAIGVSQGSAFSTCNDSGPSIT